MIVKKQRNFYTLTFLFFFRISHFFTVNGLVMKIIGFPIRMFYRIFYNYIIGLDIPDAAFIGKGLQIFHGHSIVMHPKSIIGDDCVLRHCTTIGNAYEAGGVPVIGSNVNIGAHVIIIGDISIGNNAIIGAGSVVTKSVPPNTVVVGNPARILRTTDSNQ